MRTNWTAIRLAVLVVSMSACAAHDEADESQTEGAITSGTAPQATGADHASSGDDAITAQSSEEGSEDALSIPQARWFGGDPTCTPDYCKNGGTCVEQWLWHTCVCRAGFSGQNCEQVAAASCGDGVIGPGEACDPRAPGWSVWTCSPSCQFDRNTIYRPCSSNAGCGLGHACVGGACVIPGCSSDGVCPQPPVGSNSRGICFPSVRVCVATCSSAANCAPGHTCSNGVCQSCADSRPCPSGQRCELYPGSSIGLCR